MHRFIDGEDRMQQTLLPNSLEDYVSEENPVRVIEAFIEELDLAAVGFSGMTPAATGRPAYHPSTLRKIYLYGYLNRLQSSRRLEREAQRNIELMWLAGGSPLTSRRLPTSVRTMARLRGVETAHLHQRPLPPTKRAVHDHRRKPRGRVETGSLSAGQLLDDLVGAGEQRVRQREAGRTSGL
jgi:transposase